MSHRDLDLLVLHLRLIVCLWVPGSRKQQFHVHFGPNSRPNLGDELWISVGDERFGISLVTEQKHTQKHDSPFSCTVRIMARNEKRLLGVRHLCVTLKAGVVVNVCSVVLSCYAILVSDASWLKVNRYFGSPPAQQTAPNPV